MVIIDLTKNITSWGSCKETNKMLIESCSVALSRFYEFSLFSNNVFFNQKEITPESFGLSAKPFPPSKFALSLLSGVVAARDKKTHSLDEVVV